MEESFTTENRIYLIKNQENRKKKIVKFDLLTVVLQKDLIWNKYELICKVWNQVALSEGVIISEMW